MKKELPKTWWGNLKYPCLHGVLHFAVAMRHLPGQSFLCTQGCCTWFSSKSAKRIWSNNCRRFWFTFSTSESGAWRSRPWSRPHLWQEEICCIFCDEKSPFQVSLSPLRCIQNVWVRARACRLALRPWLHLGRGMSLLQQCCCNRLLFCFGKKIILGRSMSASTRFAPRTAGVSTSCLFCIAWQFTHCSHAPGPAHTERTIGLPRPATAQTLHPRLLDSCALVIHTYALFWSVATARKQAPWRILQLWLLPLYHRRCLQ